MPHGTLTRDQNQRIICALPAGRRRPARLVACRFPNAPWRIAVLGRRQPQRLTMDDNGDLTAHVAVTGFVRPTRDDRPSLNFKPSLVTGRLVLPPHHRARPGEQLKAHTMDDHGSWQTQLVTVGDPVQTPAGAPYSVHETGPPRQPERQSETEPAKTAQPRNIAATRPTSGAPTQQALFK